MRLVVQRVTSAAVSVRGAVVSTIDRGALVLVGCGRADAADAPHRLAEKLFHLRMFEDEAGRAEYSIAQIQGAFLVVPQFTLMGSVRKGRRPSWDGAAPATEASGRVEAFAARLEELGAHVERGAFQEHMEVRLANDGPFTLVIDEGDLRRAD